jgi:hypothetical protein
MAPPSGQQKLLTQEVRVSIAERTFTVAWKRHIFCFNCVTLEFCDLIRNAGVLTRVMCSAASVVN